MYFLLVYILWSRPTSAYLLLLITVLILQNQKHSTIILQQNFLLPKISSQVSLQDSFCNERKINSHSCQQHSYNSVDSRASQWDHFFSCNMDRRTISVNSDRNTLNSQCLRFFIRYNIIVTLLLYLLPSLKSF